MWPMWGGLDSIDGLHHLLTSSSSASLLPAFSHPSIRSLFLHLISSPPPPSTIRPSPSLQFGSPKMSDYALVRTRSALSLSGPRPTVLLSRTYSVPDLSVYKPTWSSYYYPYYSWRSWYPYRYRDYSLSDYSYSYPLYRSWFPYRSSYYSDYYTSPYYWYYPYSYGSRYRSYSYDYDWPYYYRRYPYYSSPYYSYSSPYYSYPYYYY